MTKCMESISKVFTKIYFFLYRRPRLFLSAAIIQAVVVLTCTGFAFYCEYSFAHRQAHTKAALAIMIATYSGAYLTRKVSDIAKQIHNIRLGLPLPCVFCTASNHGDTVSEVVQNICEEPVEYLAVFTANGQKLAEITCYDQTRVRNSEGVLKLCSKSPENIRIHNHPTRDVPFSPADVHAAMITNARHAIVVTRESVYELILPRFYTEKEISQACKLLDRKGGILCSPRKRQIRACEQVATKFGMIFKQTARHDWVFERY